jgi:hypothetical protein
MLMVHPLSVMPGLVPGIHVLWRFSKEGGDGRGDARP